MIKSRKLFWIVYFTLKNMDMIEIDFLMVKSKELNPHPKTLRCASSNQFKMIQIVLDFYDYRSLKGSCTLTVIITESAVISSNLCSLHEIKIG